LFLCLAAVFFTDCGGESLDYDTAMNLLRERSTDPVRISFSVSPRFDSQEPKLSDAYKRLMDGHVIVCKPNKTVGTLCEPGPAGDALTQNELTDLSLVAGHWAPASIVAIRRTGRGSASAEVRMNFEPSPLFREFEDVFDQIQAPGLSLSPETRKQGKVVRVTFQRYEDGWHVENIE